MIDAGKIRYVSRGEYNEFTTYEILDIVLYNYSLWEAKKETTGNAPPEYNPDSLVSSTENEHWKLFLPGAQGGDFVKKTDIAQAPTEEESGVLGLVIPDGNTITIDPDGTIHGSASVDDLTFIGSLDGLAEAMESGEAPAGTIAFVEGDTEFDPEYAITEDRAVITDENGEFAPSEVTAEELGSLVGVTGSVQEQIDIINSPYNPAASHRNIFRGKNLGSVVTEAQWDAISDGSFTDLYVGDYWVINGIIWRIVDIDYWFGTGDVECTTHHLVIMPDHKLYDAKMNDENTTEGGYIGSKMYTTYLANAKTMVNGAFGASHVLNHRELLVNAVSGGYPSGGVWAESTVELPNEIMMYGGYIMFTPGSIGMNIPYRYTLGKTQLAAMKASSNLICPFKERQWLRDAVFTSSFADVGNAGIADAYPASATSGVRPVFGIA